MLYVSLSVVLLDATHRDVLDVTRPACGLHIACVCVRRSVEQAVEQYIVGRPVPMS